MLKIINKDLILIYSICLNKFTVTHKLGINFQEGHMKTSQSKEQGLNGKVYSISLLTLLVFAFIIYYLYLPNNTAWMIGTILVTSIIHFIIYFLIALFINLGEERPFVKQYNKVMETYEKTNDPKELYEGLKNIKHIPTKKETENAYYLSLSTALHRLNKTKEALAYLDKIETDNPQFKNIVEDQRKSFKAKKYKK